MPSIKGTIGETGVSTFLALLPDKYIVLNDIMLKNGNYSTQIDHIVISPHGIFVIETKNYKGWVYGSMHSEQWTQNIWGKKISLYNPVMQNEKHIKFLIRMFPYLGRYGSEIHSIVVFIRTDKIRISGNDGTVMRPYNMNGFIRSFNEDAFSYRECEELAKVIRKANITDRRERTEHKYRAKESAQYRMNVIDNGLCPNCGGHLVKRSGRYGIFYGCSNYPRCKYTAK